MSNYKKRYTEEFGCRLTRRDKQKAMNAISEDFEQLGLKGEVIKKRKRLKLTKNLVFGNMKSAKAAVVVPLETPTKILWPSSKYYPQDGLADPVGVMVPVLAPLVLLYVLLLFISMKGVELVKGNDILTISLWIISVALFLLMPFLLLHGFRNRKNMTRNSASIVAVLELLSKMSEAQRKQYLYIFVDGANAKAIGAEVVAEEMLKRGRNLEYICLDCIGVGETLRIGYNSNSKKLARSIMEASKLKSGIENEMFFEQRSQLMSSKFEKCCVISKGTLDKKERLVVYGTGTSKDNAYSNENVEEVVDILSKYLVRK